MIDKLAFLVSLCGVVFSVYLMIKHEKTVDRQEKKTR